MADAPRSAKSPGDRGRAVTPRGGRRRSGELGQDACKLTALGPLPRLSGSVSKEMRAPSSRRVDAGALDRGDVHEHVLAAVIGLDEAVALLRVVELDGAALAHRKSPNVRDNKNGATRVEAHRGEARKTVRNAEGEKRRKACARQSQSYVVSFSGRSCARAMQSIGENNGRGKRLTARLDRLTPLPGRDARC